MVEQWLIISDWYVNTTQNYVFLGRTKSIFAVARQIHKDKVNKYTNIKIFVFPLQIHEDKPNQMDLISLGVQIAQEFIAPILILPALCGTKENINTLRQTIVLGFKTNVHVKNHGVE